MSYDEGTRKCDLNRVPNKTSVFVHHALGLRLSVVPERAGHGHGVGVDGAEPVDLAEPLGLVGRAPSEECRQSGVRIHDGAAFVESAGCRVVGVPVGCPRFDLLGREHAEPAHVVGIPSRDRVEHRGGFHDIVKIELPRHFDRRAKSLADRQG